MSHHRLRPRSLIAWILVGLATLAFLIVDQARAATRTSALPSGWHHGAFAEIYVRGYRDSDGDGIGDLRGLTASLDYLQALGVRGLWLMPVTRSQDRDHGYAVADYRAIEPDYGSLEDFDTLLREAHARGIGVIVDYVLNHSAAAHAAFVASRDPADPHRGWYVWREEAPTDWRIFGKNPWNATPTGAYLSQFSPTMPDFEFAHPEVARFHAGNLRFWLDRGVDGFRFDAVTHLVENGPDAWNDQPQSRPIVAAMRAVVDEYPNRFVVCEATSSAQVFARPDVCGHAFAIDHAGAILAAARGDRKAIRRVARFPQVEAATLATLLSNHDAFAGERVFDQLAGDDAAYRVAAATYLLQPATPFIYYGEEIGLAGAATLEGDRRLRIPMSWSADPATAGFTRGTPFRAPAANVGTHNVAAQQADPGSLLAWYRTLLALRNTHAALARGTYEAPFVRGQAYGFQRRHGDERLLVLLNYGTKAIALKARDMGEADMLLSILPANDATTFTGKQAIPLGPRSVRVFRIESGAR